MIPLFKPHLAPQEQIFHQLSQVFSSGYIAEGEAVRALEKKFTSYIGYPVLATSSCTASLHLALMLAGARRGTEVISTPVTAEPTNLAVLYTNADLVWADVMENGNIDWRDVEMKITPRTVAVIGVDYGGVPCLTQELYSIDTDVAIIEDAAHAMGAKYDGLPLGTHVDYTCFSFQAIKHFTAGDGGLLVTTGSDEERARRMRWFGIDRQASRTEMDIRELGYKYNMNNITAAIGLAQFSHLQKVVDAHIANGKWFDAAVKGIGGVRGVEWEELAEPSYWFYTLLFESESDRDDMSEKLTEREVGNGLVHRRNDLHSIFQDSSTRLPGVDYFYSHALHIPCGWWLTEQDRWYILDIIKGG